MADTIYISDLLVRGIVGINPDEREKKQDIVVNCTLKVDMDNACRSDNIDDAVNYRTICKNIIQIIEETQYFLIEKLADHISEMILTQFAVSQATVRIDKPTALRFARSVAVEINRQPSDYA